MSREYLDWLDYSFYITNVGAEIWSPEIVGTIYRIRWQIELVFKQWKQLFRMDVMKGTREERIRCLLLSIFQKAILLPNFLKSDLFGYKTPYEVHFVVYYEKE